MIGEMTTQGDIMNTTLAYIKTVSLVLIGFLVLFIGIGAITVVLNIATWEQLGDWSAKAAIIAVIVFILNAVGSSIAGLMQKR
jgi:hypothetical protein